MEHFHGRGICVELVTEFHGASPVEYRLDQDRVVRPKHYSTGESHPLSDLFLYLWVVFVYHEAHEDHEEFTIKLYRPLRFKPRARYNLIQAFMLRAGKTVRQ